MAISVFTDAETDTPCIYDTVLHIKVPRVHSKMTVKLWIQIKLKVSCEVERKKNIRHQCCASAVSVKHSISFEMYSMQEIQVNSIRIWPVFRTKLTNKRKTLCSRMVAAPLIRREKKVLSKRCVESPRCADGSSNESKVEKGRPWTCFEVVHEPRWAHARYGAMCVRGVRLMFIRTFHYHKSTQLIAVSAKKLKFTAGLWIDQIALESNYIPFRDGVNASFVCGDVVGARQIASSTADRHCAPHAQIFIYIKQKASTRLLDCAQRECVSIETLFRLFVERKSIKTS